MLLEENSSTRMHITRGEKKKFREGRARQFLSVLIVRKKIHSAYLPVQSWQRKTLPAPLRESKYYLHISTHWLATRKPKVHWCMSGTVAQLALDTTVMFSCVFTTSRAVPQSRGGVKFLFLSMINAAALRPRKQKQSRNKLLHGWATFLNPRVPLIEPDPGRWPAETIRAEHLFD